MPLKRIGSPRFAIPILFIGAIRGRVSLPPLAPALASFPRILSATWSDGDGGAFVQTIHACVWTFHKLAGPVRERILAGPCVIPDAGVALSGRLTYIHGIPHAPLLRRRPTVNLLSRRIALILLSLPLSACFGGRVLQPAKVEPVAAIEVDRDGALDRLSSAIRFRTISHQDPADFDAEAFLGLHKHLETSFPLVHKNLQLEKVSDYTLLYKWEGSDASLKPALLMAHLDVVPTADPEGKDWSKPAYDGLVEEGYIWGRGAMDDKANVLAILEGAEKLLAEGFRPARTFYFEFGHDEEVGGERGAAAVARLLAERGVELEFVMDEGMAVVEPGIVDGVDSWVALIGIAEKGYITFELTAHAEGGHSSQPTPTSAIGQLARGIVALEENQMPSRLAGPGRDTLSYLAGEASWPLSTIYGNLWLFGPIVKGQMEKSPQTNALIRTTTAVTVIDSGTKENVLPAEARALVNHRILPGDTMESVQRHVERTVEPYEIEVKRVGDSGGDPSPVSRPDSDGMRAIVRTIREIYPEAVVAPALVLGGTDSKHFVELTDSVYRFGPMRFRADDFARVHGKDERVAIDDYMESIRFYVRLLQNAGEPAPAE